jgi:hypothetical protein
LYVQEQTAKKNNNIIQNNDGQFANSQSVAILRVNPDSTEPETQLDVVNVIEQCPDVAPEEFSRSDRQGAEPNDYK